MDTRTGHIYNNLDEAKAAGVPDEHLVTGSREALERLSAMIKERGSFKSHQPNTGAHGPEQRFCGNAGCVDCADWQSRMPPADPRSTPGARPSPLAEVIAALRELLVNANRLCDRQLGGTYEDDCRRSLAKAEAALAAEHQAVLLSAAPAEGEAPPATSRVPISDWPQRSQELIDKTQQAEQVDRSTTVGPAPVAAEGEAPPATPPGEARTHEALSEEIRWRRPQRGEAVRFPRSLRLVRRDERFAITAYREPDGFWYRVFDYATGAELGRYGLLSTARNHREQP